MGLPRGWGKMKNKDLQRLLSTFPDDLEVCEIGLRTRKPVTDVSERRAADATPYLVLETAPRPTESDEQNGFHSETRNVHVKP